MAATVLAVLVALVALLLPGARAQSCVVNANGQAYNLAHANNG